VCENYIGKN